MLFRINYENFLVHMVDYFSAEELTSLNYLLVSAGIGAQGRCANVAKDAGGLYPNSDDISEYLDTENIEIFRKKYYGFLKKNAKPSAYANIIQPILKHRHNIVLMCRKDEDFYMDILIEFLSKEFNLQSINLNELFEKGETDIYYLDKTAVHNRSVEVAREIVEESKQAYMSTDDGREKLVRHIMSDKQKRHELKKMGIDFGKKDNLDELLLAAWAPGDE